MRKRKEIKFMSHAEAVDCNAIPDLKKLMEHKKKLDKLLGRKTCDNCSFEMKFIKKYKNESGGEFHVYQCPICKGKVDWAQIKDVGEFSVHTNIVPEEAKKK